MTFPHTSAKFNEVLRGIVLDSCPTDKSVVTSTLRCDQKTTSEMLDLV